jgi:hypothetical protein
MHFNPLYLVVFVVLVNLVGFLMHLPMFIKILCFHFQVLLGAGPVTGIIIPERVVLGHAQKLWDSVSLYTGYALYSVSRVVYQHFPIYLYAYQSDIVQMIALLLPCVLSFGICQKSAMGFAFVCLCQKDFNSRLVGMIIQLDA